MNISASRRVLRFGPFEADVRAGELRKQGLKIKLQDQPFQILVLLLERPGDLVTREEIHQKLWPADTFVDFDHGLNNAVNRLREALGDSAEMPRFIETLPRKGYRFIAPVNGQATVEHAPTFFSVGGESRKEPQLDQQTPAIAGLSEKEPEVIQTISKTGYRPIPTPERVGKPSPRKLTVYAGVAALIASLALLSGLHWRGKIGRPEVLAPAGEVNQRQLTSNPPERSLFWAAISPDGKYLAYTDTNGLYLRLLDTGETHSVPLPVRFSVNSTFAWFPDNTRLLVAGSFADQVDRAWIVSVFGGAPRKLRNAVSWASVSPDGRRIAFIGLNRDGRPRELWVMDASGEDPHRIVAFDEGNFLQQVWWSPDGSRIAYMRSRQDSSGRPRRTIEACDLEGTHFMDIIENTSDTDDFYWLPDGRIIFALENKTGDSALWEVVVDPRTGMRTSEPKRIIHWPRAAFMGLSATDKGKKLLVLQGTSQNDIYVGEFDSKSVRLKTTRQFTSDERDDIPAAWTRDGKGLLFISDRSGSYDIYRQAVQGSGLQAIVAGPTDEYEPRFSPDGSWLLYWAGSFPDSAPKRLMRMPALGGGSEFVLTGGTNAAFRCPSYRGASCILSEREGMQLLFFQLDPVKGKGALVAKTERPGLQMYSIGVPMWDLSPDGSRIALADGCCRTRILDLKSGSWRDGPTNNGNLSGDSIAWSADGHGLFFPRIGTTSQILYADFQGHTHVVFEGANRDLSSLVPSPDGRSLAFSSRFIYSRNAWLLENF